MIRKIGLTMTAFLLMSVPAVQAQEEVMKVHRADGTVWTCPVDEIDYVDFGEEEPVELVNQYESGKTIHDITAVEEKMPDGFTYYVYADAGDPSSASAPGLVIRVNSDVFGRTIDLAEATAEQVGVTLDGKSLDQPAGKGTLTLQKDKFGKNLTIILDGTWGDERLRVNYAGSFGEKWQADNTVTVTYADDSSVTADIPTLLRVAPASTGAATQFAFGSVEATAASDLLKGTIGVCFALSAKALGAGTIDVQESMASYSCQVVDYATSETKESDVQTTGTITSYLVSQDEESLVFFRLDLRLSDGTAVQAEYFGPCVDTDAIDGMFPLPDLPNAFTVKSPDGQTDLAGAEVTSMQVRTSGSKVYLYFMTDDSSTPDEKGLAMPLVTIEETLINAGQVELPACSEEWEIRYNGIQLTSPGNEWKNAADNGVLSVLKEGDYYEVYVSVANTYSNCMGSGLGDGRVLTISFKGEASPYTGTK